MHKYQLKNIPEPTVNELITWLDRTEKLLATKAAPPAKV